MVVVEAVPTEEVGDFMAAVAAVSTAVARLMAEGRSEARAVVPSVAPVHMADRAEGRSAA
jgi:hypothetical protein